MITIDEATINEAPINEALMRKSWVDDTPTAEYYYCMKKELEIR